jgi:lipopolysaccharide biosynthesis protein
MRLIAFYLPQFHPIPENDRWWGKGFTEWSNVTRVAPLFEGQHQPQLPAELGFYDLRVPEIRKAQAELARAHGISGFCYYYYWFNGKKLLQRPLEEVLASGKPDFPFCVCWANENWTRRWDGGESDVLAEQRYSPKSDREFLRTLLPMFQDRRYIRVEGKPLLLIYRTELFPDPKRSAEIWREEAKKAGLELYLVRGEGFSICKPESIGFDAAYEFPPNGLPADLSIDTSSVRIYRPHEFSGHLHDYRKLAEFMVRRKASDYTRFRGVMVGWDNTARRRNRANIFVNGGPMAYWGWLSDAIRKTSRMPDDKQLIFINAWNEWAEGCHLEPDQLNQRTYLEATAAALANRRPRFSPATSQQNGCAPAGSEAPVNLTSSEVSRQLEAQDRTIQFLINQLDRLKRERGE